MIILYGSIPASLHDLHIFWEEESASFLVSKRINGEICKPLWLYFMTKQMKNSKFSLMMTMIAHQILILITNLNEMCSSGLQLHFLTQVWSHFGEQMSITALILDPSLHWEKLHMLRILHWFYVITSPVSNKNNCLQKESVCLDLGL